MIVKNKILVTGLRRFEGEIDGNKHDFTKLTYMLVDNELSNDKEKGYFTTEILAGTADMFDDLSKHKYPALFDAEMQIALNRKGSANLELVKCTFIKSIALD